ncbi:MAG TPA: hypothetical protein ENI69_03140 [Rhodospirillales bacterium]|nr:hypothetical protein [Rhodospirillales bacterium]
MHKKIIEKIMASQSKERVTYFNAVIVQLEHDGRFESQGNIIFTVLKDVIPDTPIYLDADDFADLLYDFIRYNNNSIRQIMFSQSYLRDARAMRSVTGHFITQVVALSFEKEEKGEIDMGELSVHKLTWPYRDTDVLDPDDDPEEWLAAVKRSEDWSKLQKEDRRKSGLSRIDDKAMALFKKNSDKKDAG